MVALVRPAQPSAPAAAAMCEATSKRWSDRLPLPTVRAVKLFALAASPTLFAVIRPWASWVAIALGLGLAAAFALDALRLRRTLIVGRRAVPELLLAFAPNALSLELENTGPLPVFGRWLDCLPDGDRTGRIQLAPRERVEVPLSFVPPRGVVELADVFLALHGPWRLASRHASIPARGTTRSFPDLRDAGDALPLARARQEPGLARLRRLGEGREFDALRPYRQGDDLRAVDWKASARRAELVAREYVPEKNQVLLLLLDCGRHFVAREGDRRRLDFTLEAALRLARKSLDRGDAVGLLGFAGAVRASLPPGKGKAQLRALVEAAYRLEPELSESDYGAAFDWVGRVTTRRALVCAFTDLVDEDASRVLLARTAALRPKHLPVVITLLDADLAKLESEVPDGEEAAYARSAAVRLLRTREGAIARLRQAGATVVSAPSGQLAPAAIGAYLRIKERGLL